MSLFPDEYVARAWRESVRSRACLACPPSGPRVVREFVSRISLVSQSLQHTVRQIPGALRMTALPLSQCPPLLEASRCPATTLQRSTRSAARLSYAQSLRWHLHLQS